MEQDYRVEKILYTQEFIENKIKEVAQWINETYKDSKDLALVGLLKGSILFLAQLIKSVKVDHTIDFIVASSYYGASKSTGTIKIVTDLAHDIKGKDVLIIEDIVDSGITIVKVIEYLKTKQPTSIRVASLLNKSAKRKVEFTPDKIGIEVPDLFLIGYGLDYQEKFRNLPYIGILKKEFIKD